MAANLKYVIVDRAMLFPCAAGVQMPQIGAEDSKIKAAPGSSKFAKVLPMKLVSQDTTPVNEKYVKMVSTGLSFAEEVVQDRCMHALPYDTKYFQNVFQPGELVTVPPRTHSSIGRHNKRGTDVRHMPCYLKKIIKPKQLTPLRKEAKEKALLLHKQAIETQQESVKGKAKEDDASSFFMTQPDIQEKRKETSQAAVSTGANQTQVSKESSVKKLPVSFKGPLLPSESEEADEKVVKEAVVSKTPDHDWDDHLMSRLSKLTANWIVHQKMFGDNNKEKLQKQLESWYGVPTHTDLVREEMSDGEEEEAKKAKKPKSKWRKKEAALLERVYNVTPPPVEATDPYSDDSKAPFYRQPAGIRKKKKSEEKEEAALRSAGKAYSSEEKKRAINATAHNIEVRRRPDTPPVTLRDYLQQGVGDKIYDTENLFQQEWLTGNHPVYQSKESALITMDSNNKYRKSLQREMPQQPKIWFNTETDAHHEGYGGDFSFKPEIGHKRWVDLPQPVDDNLGQMKSISAGFDPVFLKEPDPKQKRKIKQNKILASIVHEWRTKWFLNGQFADATPDDLIRDMADIQPHVRLKAIGTVAKAAEYKPPTDSSIALDSFINDPISELPEQIFVALDCLLDDNSDQVRKAAAVTLYSLDRPSEKAKVRLREMLHTENAVDRWAGAQCLAHYGECDSDVVAEIIKQILDSESAIKHEQGMALLAKISNSSTLVHCMVAEQLNSSSWRYRVIACKILPTLFGSINRDITQKLSELMWHDWHVEVRKAAAQCLGKTSHGRDVHDDIRDRILNGTERTKMEAINKLGQLGIMTAKLLPAFLQCFSDSYVSIRCEVCITCGNLQIKEEQVLDRLVHLATFDPIWKVKALAMQALGKIGVVTEDIKECLLWAMRYEERPGVRAEACHSLVSLNVQDDDVVEILQDRMLVESSPLVREEMIEALSIIGISTSDDMDTVAQIKAEVRKLCTRNIIASQIIVNENDETKREQLKRMVCQTEKDIEALNERKEIILRKIRSQAKAYSESVSSSPPPRTSTPLPTVKVGSDSSTTPEPVSREGTVFTPTADKELEAILNQDEDAESVSGSTSGKSRPITAGSLELNLDSLRETEERLQEEQEIKEKQVDESMKVISRITVTKAEEDYEVIKENSNDKSSVNNQPDKNQLSIPRSQMGVTPVGSVLDFKGQKLSPSPFSGKRSIMSRDSMREREKLNAEVNTIYADLNARYSDMVQHLARIDKGLNTKGSSAESSTVDSLDVSNVGSSHIARLSHQEIIDTIKELEYIQSARQEKEKIEQSNTEIDQEVDLTKNKMQEIDLVENEGEDNEKYCETKDDPNTEWKSFVDTLSDDDSEDMNDDDETNYPSYEDNAGNSLLSTEGNTIQDSQCKEQDDNTTDNDNDDVE